MRHYGAICCRVLVACLFLTSLSATAIAQTPDDGRRIIRFQGDLSNLLGLTQAVALVTGLGGRVIHRLTFINALAVEFPLADVTTLLANLLASPLVAEVLEDPRGVVDPVLPSTAPLIEDVDWGVEDIQGREVQRTFPHVTGMGVRVAVLDTGIGPHDDLTIGPGFRAINGGSGTADDHGHGTHMAGIIGATVDQRGIVGVAPAVTVIPIKVLDAQGQGHMSDLINGMQSVWRSPIRLANMSLQFPDDHPALWESMRRWSAR